MVREWSVKQPALQAHFTLVRMEYREVGDVLGLVLLGLGWAGPLGSC
jgi:hypothetical protein